jgi:hypothetical protein
MRWSKTPSWNASGRAPLDRQLGQHVSVTLMSSGVDWTIGRSRGLAIKEKD